MKRRARPCDHGVHDDKEFPGTMVISSQKRIVEQKLMEITE